MCRSAPDSSISLSAERRCRTQFEMLPTATLPRTPPTVASATGRRALDLARQGPMLLPPLSVDLDSLAGFKKVVFDLRLERPTVRLNINNPSTNMHVAIKVSPTRGYMY